MWFNYNPSKIGWHYILAGAVEFDALSRTLVQLPSRMSLTYNETCMKYIRILYNYFWYTFHILRFHEMVCATLKIRFFEFYQFFTSLGVEKRCYGGIKKLNLIKNLQNLLMKRAWTACWNRVVRQLTVELHYVTISLASYAYLTAFCWTTVRVQL